MSQNPIQNSLSTPQRAVNRAAGTPTPGSNARTPRKAALKDGDKLEVVLRSIQEVNWTLPKFLEALFTSEELQFTNRSTSSSLGPQLHRNMVQAFLNGTSKHHAGYIINKIYQYSRQLAYRSNDSTYSDHPYVPDRPVDDIQHAYPALAAWSVSLVSRLVHEEGTIMVKPETGLHMRARSTRTGSRVTWSAVSAFSFQTLQNIAETHTPVFWKVASAYANSAVAPAGELTVVRQQRPQNLVSLLSIQTLNGRNLMI